MLHSMGRVQRSMFKFVTPQRFLEMVVDSGLLDQKTVATVEHKVRERLGGELPTSTKRLAKVFTNNGLLTEWQVEKLLGGKYKGFFLGKYKLLGHISTGGMSSVYLAEHTKMGDKRAIKVLPKARVNNKTYLARFQLEAQAIAKLNHPNIVLAHDIDNQGDVHYIVMEYVDGLDLHQLVKRDGPFDWAVAANVIAQAARGLQHAHDRSIIHRDVKPANILVDPTGRVRILDMGLALVSARDDDSLTVVNNENVLGTADYLAPEQAVNSHRVDHRADIYGLGCTLYYLIAGRPPFGDGTLAQRIAKHQTEMPTPLRELRPDCPGELEGICDKMIQKQPDQRYQSAAAVANALEQLLMQVPARPHAAGSAEMLAGAGFRHSPVMESASSLSLGGLDQPSSLDDIPSIPRSDTIESKNDDTVSKDRIEVARQRVDGEGSGRLVAIAPGYFPQSSEPPSGSNIDLQHESGYEPETPPGPRAGAGTPAPDPATSTSSLHRQRHVPWFRRSLQPKLVTTGAILLFLLALALGFLLARLLG